MVDRDLILRKLTELEEYHAQMTGFSSVTLDQYLADWKTQRIVERGDFLSFRDAVAVYIGARKA